MTTPSSTEERIARLEGSFEQIERRMGTLEQDLRHFRPYIAARFDKVEGRAERPDSRFEQVDTGIDRLLRWQPRLLGAIAASIVATLLTRIL